ncbi:hypothetical protein Poly51_63900 [Rubripirellula tenax]|uniref:Lipoprotein n=1 Tax=Rubripirellula tenax TaxID=2528015 RepID=A0A5C6DWB6_9BACT|nr:hypothetical protein [Rubripirellula tenax]TWU41683.1 hypothetical protein Poly51_63900 [Rubripirellula tenax]
MRWIAIITITLAAGCSALNPFPKPSVMRAMKDADRIVANGHEITDRETVEGLRKIYGNAKWRPFIDTEPIDQISIQLFHGSEKVLEFSYGAGWLMDEARKGVLSEVQRQWMIDHIRSKIPAEKLPDRHII